MTKNTETRIEGAKKKVKELYKKFMRIEAAKATGWEKNPYGYSERDIKATIKELNAAKSRLDYWKSKGADEDAKAATRNIKPILAFLDTWKANQYKFYSEKIIECDASSQKVRELANAVSNDAYGTKPYKAAIHAYEEAAKLHYSKCHGYTRPLTAEEKTQSRYKYTSSIKTAEGEWECIMGYFNRGGKSDALKALEEALTNEYNAKYDSIVERASYIVGAITDATALRVGRNGELNGIILGTKAKCKIETIGAGGYNVQCFHFRVLVHELKEG